VSVPELSLTQHIEQLEKLLQKEKSTIDNLQSGPEIFLHLESIKKLANNSNSSTLKTSGDRIVPPPARVISPEGKKIDSALQIPEGRPRAHSQSRPFSLFNVSLSRSSETPRDQLINSPENELSTSDDARHITKRKSIRQVLHKVATSTKSDESAPEAVPEPVLVIPKIDPKLYMLALKLPEPRVTNRPPADYPKHLVSRFHTIEEIFVTETQYVRQLGVIIGLYLRQLENDEIHLITPEDRETIFSNIEEIYHLSRKLLQALLEEENKPPQAQLIGGAFMSMIHEFTIYTKYCTNQVDSMTALERLKVESRPFVEFLWEMHDREESLREDLPGYLIKPFQRICRYVLLLKEVLKQTPKEWPDYQNIVSAIEGLESVVRRANETKSAMDNLLKIQEIQASLEEELDLKRAVKFICEGEYKNLDAKGHTAKRHFFLFNKLLLITKLGRTGKRVKIDAIPIEKCIVWDIMDDVLGKGVKNAFQIVRTDSKDKLVLLCKNYIQKENWMNSINECICASGVLLF